MPTSRHKLVSEQDIYWPFIKKGLGRVAKQHQHEAWHIFLHLLRARRTDIKTFLDAMRTKLEQWDYREQEEPFLSPEDPARGTCWVEAQNEVRRFGNKTPELTACLGLADSIVMCFKAARIGDPNPLNKLRVIARDN